MASSGDPAWPFTKAFDERAAHVMEHFHVSGLSISVVDGEQTFAKGYGLASIQHNRPATPETLYYIGSTTKSFTAASILKLIERKKQDKEPLTLRTKLSSIIREDFVLQDQYATEHTTLEDMLCHRTGMPRHDHSIGGSDDGLRELVRRLRHLPMTAELREKWQYCNLMYLVTSYCIEKLAGCSLRDHWRTHFWSRLNMSSTFSSRAEVTNSAEEPGVALATGYWWSGGEQDYIETPYMADSPLLGGAGAIISNVLDYATWLRAMMRQDSAILSPESFAELRLPRIPVVYEGQPKAFTGPDMYGLGWRHAVYHGHQMFYHGGGCTGFGSQMAYFPTLKNGVGVTLMANTEHGSNFAAQVLLYDIIHNILDVPEQQRFDWFGFYSNLSKEHYEALSHPENTIKKTYPSVDLEKAMLPLPVPLQAYTGTYHNPGYRKVTVKSEQEVLYVDAFDRTWAHRLRFQHINGSHFLAWMSPHEAARGSFLRKSMAAEFMLDAGGNVKRLGIAYEGALGKEKTWFERSDDGPFSSPCEGS